MISGVVVALVFVSSSGLLESWDVNPPNVTEKKNRIIFQVSRIKEHIHHRFIVAISMTSPVVTVTADDS